MERRKEPRQADGKAAVLTVLGGEAGRMDVIIDNRSGSGLAIRAAQALPLSTPVRVDLDDRMLLGEVCHCAAADGGFLVGLRVEHVVEHLQSLARLARELESEGAPRTPEIRDMLLSE